jgi:hypothetical protein
MRYLGGGIGHVALRQHVKIEDAAKAMGINLSTAHATSSAGSKFVD